FRGGFTDRWAHHMPFADPRHRRPSGRLLPGRERSLWYPSGGPSTRSRHTYHGPVPTGRLPRALLAASHPEPAALVTLLTVVLSLAAGRRWDVLWVAASVACGQLAVGWSNDYLDRDLDREQARPDTPLAAPPTATGLSPPTVRAAALTAL